MAENAPRHSGSKLKGCLMIVAVFTAFFTIVPFVMSGGLARFFPPSTEDLDRALADARVTDVEMNRQQYTYQLDDNIYQHYNFNAFEAADPAARKGMNDTLGYDPSDLGHYLRLGDRLTKAAHSPLLTVRRGAVVTHWLHYSATPESKLPPTVKTGILQGGDTARIH